MRPNSPPLWMRYGVAVVSVAVATIVRVLLIPVLGTHLPFPTFFIALMLTAWYGRLGPTLLCMILGALSAAYFIIPPENTLAITDSSDLLSLTLYFLVGIVSVALSEALHKSAQRADEHAQAHQEQRRWFEVTLASIGDAVIATDNQGNVTLINTVAQALTGWPEVEALGKPLATVFHIINEHTREVVENPATQVMRAGTIVGLANHTLLITREGKEIPIEDSGAPIKDGDGILMGVVLVFRDATEHKKAAEQRSLLASIVQSSDDAIIGKTLDGFIVSWNPAAERIYGYSAGEAIGQHMSLLVPPQKTPELGSILEQLRHGQSVDHFETVRMRKDGKPIDVSVAISPIRDESGQVTGASAISRDITERKRHEVRLQYLWDASTILASSLDLEITLRSIAQAAVPQMADWCVVDLVTSSGEVRRLAVAHVDPDKARLAWEQHQWHPEDLDAPEGVSKVLRTRKSELYADIPRALVEASARDSEHQKILEELGLTSAMIVPLIANERLLGAITFVTSESGRHYGQSDLDLAEELARRAAMAVENARLYNEAQAAIGLHRSTEERLALLMEASGTLLGSLRLDDVLPAILDLARRSIAADAYAVWRASSTLDDWHIVASTGLSEEYQATSLDSISRSTPAEKAIVVEDVEQDQALESRHQLYKTEGIRSLLVLPLKIHGSHTGTLVFYFRQPHHFDEAEVLVASALANLAASAIGTADLYEEQSRMRIEAQAANRTKDEFLATLSHELRTPLTAMMGWISLLRSGKLDEATTAQAMETIERNTKSQAQLIEDILDVSRIITGKIALDFHPLEIGPIVEAALVSLRPSAMNKGILIESGIDVTGPVSGDPRRLQQVIWNLVSNAIKFTPRGGKIQVSLHRADSSVELTVADSGQGISPEFLPHVFDRFRQADGTSTRQHGGLGLGLSIVRHIVELHGGTVQVESAGEGQGATFRVRLPLLAIHASRTKQSLLAEADSNGSQEAPMSTPLLSTRLRGKKILIVDDEPDSRILITSTLKLHSAETRDASSAAQALSILDGWRPDLIITDIGMPGEDGYDLIRKVRERSSGQGGVIPAVALTAYVSPGDSAHASAAGFQMHIAKPVGPDELTAAIVELTTGPDSPAEGG